MPTIQVTLSPEELVQIVDQMPADELADFTARVLAVQARRTVAALAATEDKTLRALYAAQLPPEQQARLRSLGQKLEVEDALSANEQQELQALSEQAEQLNAERMKKVTELAALWGKPLPAVMHQLGLWRGYGE
ncbi:MAG: hypothetical protein KJZ86_03060 [Caldilineaceae bacterium]|nr:hypothetical protein [Caldilineaceae bacterium]HRJ45367.1 hypothetical protein [Caldilineaceae bacterium]